MANQEQVELLLSGVDKWNAWRGEDNLELVDLSGANLQGADLHEAYLQMADLQRADLRGANLRDAHLVMANLANANLQEAILQGAFLQAATLRGANLQDVKLQGARLIPSQWSDVEGHIEAAHIEWNIPSEILNSLGNPSLTRSIEFAPEHRQAGIQILSYFGTIVDQKYPNQNVTVAITQEGLLVKMTITAPTGELLEEVKQSLEQYGAIVLGHEPASALLSDPTHVMQLTHSLQMANMVISHQKDMLLLQRSNLDKAEQRLDKAEGRLEKVETSYAALVKVMGTLLIGQQDQLAQSQQDFSQLLDSLIEGQSSHIQAALNTLEHALSQNDVVGAEAALETINSEEPELLKRLKNMAERTIGTGTGFMLKELLERLFGV